MMTAIQEELDKLKSQIAELEDHLIRANAKTAPAVIDESYIGHIVEVRDDNDSDFIQDMLVDIDDGTNFPYSGFPYVVGNGEAWGQCRPRQDGPSVGKWIEHDGSPGVPAGIAITTIILADEGGSRADIYACFASGVSWAAVKRYAVVKVG